MNTNEHNNRPLANFTDEQLQSLLSIGQQAATLLYHLPVTDDTAAGWLSLDTLTKQAVAETAYRGGAAVSIFDADETQETVAVRIDAPDAKLDELMRGIEELRGAGAYDDKTHIELTQQGRQTVEFLERREQRILGDRLRRYWDNQQ